MPMNNSRPIMYIFSIILLLCLLSSDAFAEHKLTIALFKYEGAVQGQEADVKFGGFRGILKNKLLNLKKEVLQKWSEQQEDGGGLEYLDGIHIEFRDSDSFSKEEDIHKWMNNESDVLTLLRGSIISDDNVTYVVYSNFYLGNLKTYLPNDVITVSLQVKSTEFGNTRDTHTLVFLYALAMDAKRLGYGRDVVALFLKAANNRIADVKRREGHLSGDLEQLEAAIVKANNELLGIDDGADPIN